MASQIPGMGKRRHVPTDAAKLNRIKSGILAKAELDRPRVGVFQQTATVQHVHVPTTFAASATAATPTVSIADTVNDLVVAQLESFESAWHCEMDRRIDVVEKSWASLLDTQYKIYNQQLAVLQKSLDETKSALANHSSISLRLAQLEQQVVGLRDVQQSYQSMDAKLVEQVDMQDIAISNAFEGLRQLQSLVSSSHREVNDASAQQFKALTGQIARCDVRVAESVVEVASIKSRMNTIHQSVRDVEVAVTDLHKGHEEVSGLVNSGLVASRILLQEAAARAKDLAGIMDAALLGGVASSSKSETTNAASMPHPKEIRIFRDSAIESGNKPTLGSFQLVIIDDEKLIKLVVQFYNAKNEWETIESIVEVPISRFLIDDNPTVVSGEQLLATQECLPTQQQNIAQDLCDSIKVAIEGNQNTLVGDTPKPSNDETPSSSYNADYAAEPSALTRIANMLNPFAAKLATPTTETHKLE